jgi:antitoxin ParD1/3/4
VSAIEENKTLSIPVPKALETFINERIKARGFQTVSEYVRSLIRADQEEAARQQLEAKLLEAVERGNYKELTPEFWEQVGKAAKERRTKPGKKQKR